MKAGLYNLNEFKDNCGFGLITHVKGEASNKLLKLAIDSLSCMTHRGGVAADGKTGDGCGLLMQKPKRFLTSVCKENNIPLSDDYAVGAIMLSVDETVQRQQMQCIEEVCSQTQLNVYGWRTVPIHTKCLGSIALKSLPEFKQIFVGNDSLSKKQLNAHLLVARRRIEKQLELLGIQDSFAINSFSADTIVYKGLMLPIDLPHFFVDLSDERMETAICVFHQRFSTNTLPKWYLAQPFRMLAHNGEINTIVGNRNWSLARTSLMESPLIKEVINSMSEITPLVDIEGSDSLSLDNMFEYMTLGGLDIHESIRMLVPPAWQNNYSVPHRHRVYFEFNAMHMEPWDGPAGLVMTDGRYAICALDRNGLRPSRWVKTKDDFVIVASEAGVARLCPQDEVAKGRLGPGQIISIDTQEGRIRETKEIDDWLSSRHPYSKWLRDNSIRIKGGINVEAAEGGYSHQELMHLMKLFSVSTEECRRILKPMIEMGQENTGAMGDDIPMAVLSRKNRPLYDYFRQQFAQVTNPPIDPLRESLVMSLETIFGAEDNLFVMDSSHAKRLIFSSPILSTEKYKALLAREETEFSSTILDINYHPDEFTLPDFIKYICQLAEQAARDGVATVVLSDKKTNTENVPAHALMITGAVHQHLVKLGLRCQTNIVVDTGSLRDSHHVACLVGYGATAVHPYLSYSIINWLIDQKELFFSRSEAQTHYRKALNKGLLKILSKMGISTIASYRGSQLFEAVGLASEVIQLCFNNTVSRIEGATFQQLHDQALALKKHADSPQASLALGGYINFIHGEEYHCYNPDVIQSMHTAVNNSDYNEWKRYAKFVNERPIATLRDMLVLKHDQSSIELSEVEEVKHITKRFESAGMSLGALSPEAHQTLAEALNTIGGRSNSGEGGEDPERFQTMRCSKIKQVASGRFGVTAEYLMSAEVIQIKIAQGAKPGEGGQLPGGKVNQLIARLRFSVPGVTLISPPPHHDIYSIEDLAQLIFDLKQVNPTALISVKLVSRPGVGTIATGVAKAYADFITISGYDGGTAASPLSSIRYAGSPWELGLSETHQMLMANDLRDKIRVQVDGGLKSGLDVVKAAILGAESFGFGTGPMVAIGCKYLRICHLNNCATGVATQDEYLRSQHYHGSVEKAVNYFTFMAQETREWMALLGVSSLESLVGRVDLLEVLNSDKLTPKQQGLDLSPIIHTDELLQSKPKVCQVTSNSPFDKAELAAQILNNVLPAIDNKSGGEFSFYITNSCRSIGANVSGKIAKKYGNTGIADAPITINFTGSAGQSFGVWNAEGLHLNLEGEANDYVGKGMSGGSITIYPPVNVTYKSYQTSIIGNTCLYGATGGRLFVSGIAGERFAVRNSGAYAIVEGTGAHCCEYMTGGVVVVLGEVGVNFGAGMTGGLAFVLDLERTFMDKFNPELIEIKRIVDEREESYNSYLFAMIKEYCQVTNSSWGYELLRNFDDYVDAFWLVKPKAANLSMLIKSTKGAPQ